MAGKYDHIDFKPPKSVADAAARGLELRQKAKKSHKGGLSTGQAAKEGVGSGVQRAVNLKNRDTMSPETVRRMLRFFQRHEKNKKIDKDKTALTDKGYQAWMLWSGDPGYAWARKIVRQMEAADKKAKASIDATVQMLKTAGIADLGFYDAHELVAIANQLDQLLHFDGANTVDQAIQRCLRRKTQTHEGAARSI